MKIVSASDSVVVVDMGITYLNYTFSSSYERYEDLFDNAEKLQAFMNGEDAVPTIYDAVLRQKDDAEYLSLTVQKPQFQTLSEFEGQVSVEGAEAITTTVLDVISSARESDIYHLDIGAHTVCYDDSLFAVQVIDWYDSVLSVPNVLPVFMSWRVPPEVSEWSGSIDATQLRLAENYQLCCFFVDVLQSSELEKDVPKVLLHGCSSEVDERPTLQTIRDSIHELFEI